MMIIVVLEQQRDSTWPNSIFTNIREQEFADELSNGEAKYMEMGNELKKVNPLRHKGSFGTHAGKWSSIQMKML